MRSLLWVLCLPLVAPAQETRSYQLKNGEVVRARINSVDQAADRVEYQFFAGGGTGNTARKLSDFSPHSQFNMLRTTVDANDIEGHVTLAEFAVDHGLIAAGKRELFKARDIAQDEGMAPEVEARIMDQAVSVLDGLLRGMLDEGKFKDADYVLHEIMAGERITEAQKDHFTDLVESRSQQVEAEQARTRASQRSADLSAARQRQLKPLRDRIERGEALQERALRGLKNQTTALNNYSGAIREFQAVQQQAERLTETHSNDADFVAELASLSQHAQDEMVSCMLSQASIYTTRSSFNQALGLVGQVLAVDSQNKQALNMRARIEIAANSGW